MLESPVMCTSISEQPSTTRGTSPETLARNVTQPASQNSSALVLPSDIGSVPDLFGRKQEQPTEHAVFLQRTAAILKSLPQKNRLQEELKRKETRDQRKSSNIQLQ